MKDKIEELRREDATVYKAMSAYQGGHCTYEEALEMALIATCEIKQDLFDRYGQLLMNSPATVIINSGDYIHGNDRETN